MKLNLIIMQAPELLKMLFQQGSLPTTTAHLRSLLALKTFCGLSVRDHWAMCEWGDAGSYFQDRHYWLKSFRPFWTKQPGQRLLIKIIPKLLWLLRLESQLARFCSWNPSACIFSRSYGNQKFRKLFTKWSVVEVHVLLVPRCAVWHAWCVCLLCRSWWTSLG